MLRRLLSVVLIFGAVISYGQDLLNMELLSHIEFDENGTDIWGFVDKDGTEYAVMGTRTATRIYSLEDPRNPIERYVVRGAASVWRDIKYYNDHLYVTTDQGSDGLTIIDVSMAPDSFSFTRWIPELTVGAVTDTFRRAHNIYIDVPTGFAYIAGHNLSRRGVMLLDLKQDPKVPVLTSYVDAFYSHDAYVLDDILYSSELGSGLAIYDVSDKTNPVELSRRETSSDFCHNAWASDDNNYVYSTDERPNAYLDSYDVTDKGTIVFLDKFRPLESLDLPVIPHNTHVLQNYAITSWYTDGIVITDMSRPDNIIQVGHYDTFTDEGSLNPNSSWFSGCWGAYPYLPSGIVLASDINSGLYVLGWDKIPAAYLEGVVTSGVSFEQGKAIQGARVEILDGQLAFDETTTDGNYKTGRAAAGTVRVAFSHPNYNSDTLAATLVNGTVTILNAELTSNFLSVSVTDASTGAPIEGASVVLVEKETGSSSEILTDEDGIAKVSIRGNHVYDIFAGHWGHKHQSNLGFSSDELESNISIQLESGYMDDFFADLGWDVTSFANSGNWVRAVPNPTDFNGDPSNAPADLDTDLGNMCWVTGNAGGGAGDDDVDDGITTLVSPTMDMSPFNEMTIEFQTWFFNDGGNSDPNDTMKVELTNGQETILLQNITRSSTTWSGPTTYVVSSSDIEFTDKMQVIFAAGDYNPGHLVEGGVDAFRAEGRLISNVTDRDVLQSYSISPNPAINIIQVKSNQMGKADYELYHANGSKVLKGTINGPNATIAVQQLTVGNYILKITHNNKSEAHQIAIVK